jgi:hypothetical protein
MLKVQAKKSPVAATDQYKIDAGNRMLLKHVIIQHIDTLPKYGKMILDICHIHMTDILRYLSSEG